MKAVELFVGGGGLALGTADAGFDYVLVLEQDRHACETIRVNKTRGVEPVSGWTLFEGDVRNYDFSRLKTSIDLLSGGPPCQPFSLGGLHRGVSDERNMFPAVVDTMQVLKPKAFILENVKGLLRPAFRPTLEYVLLMLSYPEVRRRRTETFEEHGARLKRHGVRKRVRGLEYEVTLACLNASDYGVPQRRERVFIVGYRTDLDRQWSPPHATHSAEALFHSKWIEGDYWEHHKIPKRLRPQRPEALRGKLSRAVSQPSLAHGERWNTVRDAIGDLPEPCSNPEECIPPNHWLNPGARSYPGHTGSSMDEPAKTLKAGNHGVPGGENMLACHDGSVRYFTVRECARLQTFPDNYVFSGSWTESMRQLGNAVPVRLAAVVAESVLDGLRSSR